MPAAATNPLLSRFHPHLVEAVRLEAGRSADRVADFLGGLTENGGVIPPLPLAILLELGAALTLGEWELGGLGLGREAGLPDARDAVRAALATLLPGVRPPGLATTVLGLFVERTAWAARPHLDADVRLDDPGEDELVEALARFALAARRLPVEPR